MEPLKDPLGDRVVNSVPRPPHHPLSLDSLLKTPKKLPSWSLLRDHFYQEGQVTKQVALHLIQEAGKLLKKEPNILYLSDPITIIGDIHGQYFDFLKILEIGGNPENTRYLFLGDYVDRGIFSIEVLLLLYSIKIVFPDSVFFLRGNHESRQMTTFFNFRSEVLNKFDLEVYEAIMDSFDNLPLACIINKKFIAVHGGLSPDLSSLSDIEKIDRFVEPPRSGIFCDMLWSDPVDSPTGTLIEKFKYNNARSCSFYFGQQAANKFLKANGLSSVIRAHEAQLEGYKMHRWNGQNKFPVVITLFSAPNYCDCYNNKGALLKLVDNTLNIQQYSANPHPYHLPNFLNVFTWSIPFVIEKTLELMTSILKPSRHEPAKGELVEKMQEEMKEARREALKNKIKTVSRMMKMFKTLRQEQETIINIKGLSSDNKIPRGLLIEGKEALVTALEQFAKVKETDSVNEGMPSN
jgi:serine/threonine-protein phosphatase 2B catalytic subunit